MTYTSGINETEGATKMFKATFRVGALTTEYRNADAGWLLRKISLDQWNNADVLAHLTDMLERQAPGSPRDVAGPRWRMTVERTA